VTGSYEHSNEPSGFIKNGEILDQLSDHQFPEKDFAVVVSLKN
jgi:hypothetical protein